MEQKRVISPQYNNSPCYTFDTGGTSWS